MNYCYIGLPHTQIIIKATLPKASIYGTTQIH